MNSRIPTTIRYLQYCNRISFINVDITIMIRQSKDRNVNFKRKLKKIEDSINTQLGLVLQTGNWGIYT